jgi:hypothetical protein
MTLKLTFEQIKNSCHQALRNLNLSWQFQATL